MNTTAPSILPGYQSEGNTAYIADNIHDLHVLTITGRPTSFHVKVMILPGQEPELRRILFGEKSERVVDEVATWTMLELATVFDTWRTSNATDDEFARNRGAQLGIRGKYLRTDNQVIFLGPPSEGGKGDISMYLDDDINRRAALFFKTGRANPVAS